MSGKRGRKRGEDTGQRTLTQAGVKKKKKKKTQAGVEATSKTANK